MDLISRKSLLYRSGLGFFGVNHVQGCSHGCRYPCYAYMMARSHGRVRTYGDWRRPKPVADAAELLKKELSRRRVKPDSIHLCLTTDPFMTGYPAITEISLKLIAICNSYGIPCSVLTKGVLPSDLANRQRFLIDNCYGISLISLNEDFRKRWEPAAAPYHTRISALKYLHDHGCRTLVHIEPYPTPNIINQNLEEILEAVKFTDEIYFGGWNYNPLVRQYRYFHEFYGKQAELVGSFCREYGITCTTGE